MPSRHISASPNVPFIASPLLEPFSIRLSSTATHDPYTPGYPGSGLLSLAGGHAGADDRTGDRPHPSPAGFPPPPADAHRLSARPDSAPQLWHLFGTARFGSTTMASMWSRAYGAKPSSWRCMTIWCGSGRRNNRWCRVRLSMIRGDGSRRSMRQDASHTSRCR